MPNLTQEARHIALSTPLGEDELLLRSFSVHEEVSRLFEINLDLLSENPGVNFDDIIGKNVTIRMDLPAGGTRYWNGYINRFVQGVSTSARFAQYQATMVPWLWFLTRTSDCRIFQGKTVPEIVNQIFNDLGFSDIEDRLSGGYRTWTYCVQYRETDFNFVSRLMEQEGIYYYFLHEQDKCTIVLCDSRSKHDVFGDYDTIESTPDTRASSQQERIHQWTVEKIIQPGKFAHTDYNFEKPSTSLMSNEENTRPHNRADYEIYDYPGEYPEKSDGDRYAKVRMEELARAHEICNGQSDSRGICPGYLFELARHIRRDQNREYLILSADCHASAEDYETSGGQDAIYSCSFTAIPSTIQFRPARTTPKPIIQGTQTAVVTGPSGEEIYTDEHGQVKVQFHWDREGGYDANSSCWVRVSQVHAGKSFGGIDIPRIGEEVIVSFMEGDPDRPLITGRVYNAELMPPFGLPDQKVVSGMKTNSTPGGGGYNEFTLNDTSGNEGIILHGQHNMDSTIENDETLTVHNDRTITVDGDSRETVGGSKTIIIDSGPETKTVGTSQSLSVDGPQTMLVNGNRAATVTGTEDKKVQGDSWYKYGGAKSKMTAGATHEIFVGAKATQNLSATSDFTAGVKQGAFAGLELTTNASVKVDRIAGLHIENNSATKKLTAAAKLSQYAGTKKEAAGAFDIESLSTYVVDSASIKLSASGKISIDASDVIIVSDNVKIIGNLKVTGKINDKTFEAPK